MAKIYEIKSPVFAVQVDESDFPVSVKELERLVSVQNWLLDELSFSVDNAKTPTKAVHDIVGTLAEYREETLKDDNARKVFAFLTNDFSNLFLEQEYLKEVTDFILANTFNTNTNVLVEMRYGVMQVDIPKALIRVHLYGLSRSFDSFEKKAFDSLGLLPEEFAVYLYFLYPFAFELPPKRVTVDDRYGSLEISNRYIHEDKKLIVELAEPAFRFHVGIREGDEEDA